ncbi:molecular chaperone Hsp20 [Halobacteriales archaeon QS_8_65_32]|jgi:HSP20 family molecular chaperone IbpA|nr:MAG: molecular chaperone Hsp20 [Halobacteriales archaeon QS_8_65_32]
MSRLREIGEAVGQQVFEQIGRVSSRAQERRPLPVDLLESDDAYLAVFDAPSAEREDVQVRLDENTLYVRIDRFRDFYEDFEMRLPGRGLALDGSVDLPEEARVDADDAKATLTSSGTIQVRVPKQNGGGATIDVEDEEGS